MSEAVYFLRIERQLVPVMDVALVGQGDSLHVIGRSGFEHAPICGVRGAVHDLIDGVDAHAIVVHRRGVCGNCRGLLEIPNDE